METAGAIVLFDGVCNLCNKSVQFIIRHDKLDRFRFASLQGETGQAILKKHGLPPDQFNSFILAEGEKVSLRSTGALRMLKLLGGGWSVLYVFIIVPPFIRDAVYNLVARYRYHWFGRKASCMVPTPAIRHKFLD